MKNLLILFAYFVTTIARLLGPGGAKAIVADCFLMKQQLLIINRTRQRSPNLSVLDRYLSGFWSLFISQRYLNTSDLERKLDEFRQYYHVHRVHTSLDGETPSETGDETDIHRTDLMQYTWKSHCRSLYHLPIAI